MIPVSRKRKHRSRPQVRGSTSRPYDQRLDESDTTRPDPLHPLYIQAYEADIVRGSHAQTAAQSLEVLQYTTIGEEQQVHIVPKIGSALIRWGGIDAITSMVDKRHRDDTEDDMLPPLVIQEEETPTIWVDR